MTGADDGIFFAFLVLSAQGYPLDTSYFSLLATQIEDSFDENGKQYNLNQDKPFHPCNESELRSLGQWNVFDTGETDMYDVHFSSLEGMFMCLDAPGDLRIYGNSESGFRRNLYI